MSEPQFSLLDEPWVLVRTIEGRTEELSILDVFRRAPELERIVGDLPTQAFAILRVLLAVLARAVDGPPDIDTWHDLDTQGPPMDRIEAYCERHRDRFWLFHPQTPFFQVADLHTAKNELSGLEKLVADVPAGHPYFTTRIGPGLERITAAEGARWLVHAQAYDCSGIKSGAVGDPRVKSGRGYPIGTGWAGALGGVYVEDVAAGSLWRTLLLNLIPTSERGLVDADERDRPAWEADPSGPAEAPDLAKRPYGPLDLFTWQARRVRLHGDATGVRGVVLANGDKLAPPYRWELEPMTAWRRSQPQEKKLKLNLVYMPREHRPERAYWRGLGGVLPAVGPRSRARDGEPSVTPAVFEWAAKTIGRGTGRSRVRLRAVGLFYGTMSATVTDLYDDFLDVSPELLREQSLYLPTRVVQAIERAEEGVAALRNLASNLSKAAGKTDDKLVDGARQRASEAAYAALDQPFRDWVAGLGPEIDTAEKADDAVMAWHRVAHPIIRRLGAELVADAGTAAWIGREVGGRRITSPEADAWFRRKLFDVLPTPQEPATVHTAPTDLPDHTEEKTA